MRCLGGILAALVLFLAATSAAPTVHKALHSDADHQDHTCAITLFAHGVESGAHSVQAGAFHAQVCVWQQSAPESACIGEPAHLHPPASGPPAV